MLIRREALALAVVLGAAPALAQPAPSASAPGAPPDRPAAPAEASKLEEAKELFRRGNTLRKAGSREAALELYQRSRGLVPSVANTQNAANMLDELGRHDEALELYETLLVEFAGKLSEDDRRDVSAALGALQQRVGSVFVSANVEGALVIDGRRRGELPLGKPVRVLPGQHRVVVLRDGYEPAEASTRVEQGQTALVELKLSALSAAGRLVVSDESAEPGVEVLIDGAPVGVAPWAGQVAPGRHLLSLRGKDAGTAPREVTVLVGQTVSAALRSEPIGPPVRIEPEPATARLTLDGVDLGPGPFQGRLPRRALALVASEEGYFREERVLEPGSQGQLIRLRVDDKHPRWRKASALRIRMEAMVGGALGGSLGSDAEASCPGRCSSRSRPAGWLAGARGALLLGALRFEAGAGYLSLGTSLRREVPSDATHAFRLDDELSVAGPFATLGVGYGIRASEALRLVASASLGAFFAQSSDAIGGQIVRGSEQVPLEIRGAGGAARGVDFFALPELRAELSSGRLHAGLGLGLGVFFLDGPALPHGEAYAAPSGLGVCAADRTALACVAGTDQLAGERPYRRHLLVLPTASVGWQF